MIVFLPPEIISHIANDLHQIDAVSLACTCTLIYSVVQPRLYSCVSIDASKYHYHEESEFEKENNEKSKICIPNVLNDKNDAHTRIIPVTIKSLYSLKLFLKNLIAHPEYCSFIQVLSICNKIPDICEYDFLDRLKRIFPHSTSLKVLDWFSIEIYLPISLVQLLPRKQNLVHLNGNFKNFTADFLGVSVQLRELNLSAFNQAENLKTVNLENCPYLRKLVLSKRTSANNRLIKNETTPELKTCLISNLIESNPVDDLCEINSSYLAPILLSKKGVLNLRVLGLSGISISSEEASLLVRKLNLNALEELSIDDCKETLLDNSGYSRITTHSTSFLDILAPKLTSLKVVNLGVHNDVLHNENVYQFFKEITSSLIQIRVLLKVNIHDDLTHQLASLVAILSLHSRSLKYLNLDYELMGNGSTPIKPASYSMHALSGLMKMVNLQYLKLPMNVEHIYEGCLLLQPLKKLQFLQLLLTDGYKTSERQSPGLISSSLISQDYFCYPNELICGLQNQQTVRFRLYCSQIRAILSNLHYVSFQSKGDRNVMNEFNFVFSCKNSGNIILQDNNLLNAMDGLVEACIRQDC